MVVHLLPIRDATAAARPEHRSMIAQVQQAGLAAGRRHETDVLALVFAAANDPLWHPDGPTHWTRPGANWFLKGEIPNWCSHHRCLAPEGIPEAVWDFLGVLAATGRMDAASDPLEHLREPLICYGGLGFDGNPRGETPTPIPCHCDWPVGEEQPDPHWDPALGHRRD
jgi:hypothetical protein